MSIDVRLKISLLVETLAAIRTVVHVRIRMRAHVVVKVGQLLKSATAFLALVRFLAGVGVMMDAFVDFLVKPFATKVAFVRLVVRMRFHVCTQI